MRKLTNRQLPAPKDCRRRCLPPPCEPHSALPSACSPLWHHRCAPLAAVHPVGEWRHHRRHRQSTFKLPSQLEAHCHCPPPGLMPCHLPSMSLLLLQAFQTYLTMLGSSVLIPSLLVPAMGGTTKGPPATAAQPPAAAAAAVAWDLSNSAFSTCRPCGSHLHLLPGQRNQYPPADAARGAAAHRAGGPLDGGVGWGAGGACSAASSGSAGPTACSYMLHSADVAPPPAWRRAAPLPTSHLCSSLQPTSIPP